MPIVSIYSNKGGVGKSTLTVGLAEFLSCNLKKRVLVIDLDAQASTTCALLGRRAFRNASTSQQTIVDLMQELKCSRSNAVDINKYIVSRRACNARGQALAELALLVPDKSRQVEYEERLRLPNDRLIMQSKLRPIIQKRFDYTLIDFPGNVDQRQRFAINGLLMSDFVVVPIDPTQITLNATPDTFEVIAAAQQVLGNGKPAVLGLIKNQTDHRTQQARANLGSITEAASHGEMPDVFRNFWPPASIFQTTTDEKMRPTTLMQKYGTYYEHARKVAKELHDRCERHQFTTSSQADLTRRFKETMEGLLAGS